MRRVYGMLQTLQLLHLIKYLVQNANITITWQYNIYQIVLYTSMLNTLIGE